MMYNFLARDLASERNRVFNAVADQHCEGIEYQSARWRQYKANMLRELRLEFPTRLLGMRWHLPSQTGSQVNYGGAS